MHTIALPSPDERNRHVTYEHDPEFGDYIFCEGRWTHRRQFADGQPLLVSGAGRRPTTEQKAMFREIDSRLPELARAAILRIDAPPVLPARSLAKRPQE